MQESSRTRQFSGPAGKVTSAVAIIFSIYELLYVLGFFSTGYAFLYPGQFRVLALALILTVVFLFLPAHKSAPRDKVPWYDILAVVLSCLVCGYIFVIYEALVERPVIAAAHETVLGIVAIVVILEAARRAVGMVIPVLAAVFFAYALWCDYLPGFLEGRGYSLTRVVASSYLFDGGLFGMVLHVVVIVIFMFVLFGSFLQATGASKFFVDLSLALFGHVRGGPAKAAVIGSSLMGMVNGSPLANVATTGVVTIPMMKNLGYRPTFAGAVESVASTGGTLLPPVMGATAFLMAEFLQIPYLAVCVAALLPSILYYLAVFIMVDLEAVKCGLVGMDRKDLPSLKKTLKQGWHYLLPVVVLIYYLAVRAYSPEVSCAYALAVLLVVSAFKKETRMTLKKLIDAFEATAVTMTQIAPVASAIGIIVTCIALTGLDLRLSGGLVQMAGGNLAVLMILAAITSLILGMGVPPLSSYVMLALLVAPAFVSLGVTPIGAHLFILYFTTISFITPPVCVAVYVASGISGAPFMQTGIEAVKLGVVAFIVPFMFILHPVLLLMGTPLKIFIAVLTSSIGCVALSIAVAGYFFKPVAWSERALMGIVALLLIHPDWWSDALGLGVFGILFVFHWVKRKKTPAPVT